MGRTAVSTQIGFIPPITSSDISSDLPRIVCPTLVITTEGNASDSVEETRAWQQRIPRSTLLVLPGDSYHVAASDADGAHERHLISFCMPKLPPPERPALMSCSQWQNPFCLSRGVMNMTRFVVWMFSGRHDASGYGDGVGPELSEQAHTHRHLCGRWRQRFRGASHRARAFRPLGPAGDSRESRGASGIIAIGSRGQSAA